MKKVPIFLMILLLTTGGCRFPGSGVSARQSPEKPRIPRIENRQLAKLILTPKTEKLRVARDPFKPLIAREESASREPVAIQNLNVMFLGSVKVGDEVRALVQVNDKKEFVRENDTVQGYTVESINMDQVVFAKGDQQKIIKRGELK